MSEDSLIYAGKDTFLVRESPAGYSFVVSIYSEQHGFLHTKIEETSEGFKFADKEGVYPSIPELIARTASMRDFQPVDRNTFQWHQT
jgi:hypothetical protein